MPVDIKVPSVGEAVTEGRLIRWFKQNGDIVRKDEPLYELETDKASQEIPAPTSGQLRTMAAEGDTVQVGSTIGSIDDQVAVPAAVPAPKPAPQPMPSPAEVAISPAARRVAAEQGIDPTKVVGSGRGGVIVKEDLLKPAPAPAPAPAPVARNGSSPTPTIAASSPAPVRGERTTRTRMSSIRARIAERLLHSQQSTASLTTFNEVDMSAVMELRNRYKDRFKEKHQIGLGFMSFFVKAAVNALKAFPVVNARIEGSDIVHQHFFDIGVAVSTERGLMVPILRDADAMTFAGVEAKIVELAVRAKEGKISVNDLQGGTFTITNGGIFGSMLSTPILNPPQCAILGMHNITKRAVVVNDQIVIRPMMYVALTYDHRLIDGREAVQFLVRIKECIENPERLLLEV